MNSKIKFFENWLSNLPNGIIPFVSAHLTDYSVLDKSLRNKELTIIYHISFS